MKKIYSLLSIPLSLLFILSGCSAIGEKSMSMSVIYVATTILSFLLLICYTCFSNKKNVWMMLLFSSVFVVNAGYLTLSISTNINEALLANRISYLVSVFLPMSMLMLILEACNFKYKRWFPLLLICVAIPIFLIAASPGYLDIYYKSASLVTVNGFTTLDKVYGEWHSIYLYYLIGYFASTITIITYSVLKKKIKSALQAVILFTAVFINIGIWLIEQLVHIEFEILSVSYIATELFLLSLNLLYKEQKKQLLTNNITVKEEIKTPENEPVATTLTSPATAIIETKISNPNVVQSNIITEAKTESEIFAEQCEYFASQLKNLTPSEHSIYELYLAKKSTREILDILNIKETTLKYHNKNIYSKLGVSSLFFFGQTIKKIFQSYILTVFFYYIDAVIAEFLSFDNN